MEHFLSLVHYAAVIAFALAAVFGGLRDLCTFEIPNWISLLICFSFLAAATTAGWSGAALLANFATGLAMLAVGTALFFLGVVGGGDVKLMAAASVWMGWTELLPFLFAVAVGGGALALLLIVFRRLHLPARAWPWVRSLHGQKGVPYGVAIAAAAIALTPGLPVV